jgi:hypothetical protein
MSQATTASQLRTPRIPAPERSWQHSVRQEKSRSLFTLTTWQIGLLVLVCVGMFGAIFGVVAWRQSPPQPLFIPCFVTKYRASEIIDNLPADADREAIKSGSFFPANLPYASFFRAEELLKRWNTLATASEDQPVVIYHSSYAIVDNQGKVRLLASDSAGHSPSTALPLSLLLSKLRECPAKQKLLILDIYGPPSRLGPWEVGGDVYAGVERDLAAEPDPHRLVLLSSSTTPAFAEDAVGRTGFGYFFTRGLCGEADGILSNRAADGRISVREISEYTYRWVSRWSDVAVGVTQQPKLIGEGSDFDLTLCREHVQASLEDDVHIRPIPAWLKQCWHQREKLSSVGVDLNGRGMRRLDLALLRAERRWQMGDTSSHLREDTQGEIKLAMRSISAVRDSVLQLPTLSAAIAIRQKQVAQIPLAWKPIRTSETPNLAKDSSAKGASKGDKTESKNNSTEKSSATASKGSSKSASPTQSGDAVNLDTRTANVKPQPFAAAEAMLGAAQTAWQAQAITLPPEKVSQARATDVGKTLAALTKTGLSSQDIAVVIAQVAAGGDLHDKNVLHWLVALDKANSPQALLVENHILRTLAKSSAAQAESPATTATNPMPSLNQIANLLHSGGSETPTSERTNEHFDTAYQSVSKLQQAAAHLVAAAATTDRLNECWRDWEKTTAMIVATGFVSKSQLGNSLEETRQRVDAAAAKIAVIAATRREISRALLLLPATAEVAARDVSYAPTWFATCRLATRLAGKLDDAVTDSDSTSAAQLENGRLQLAGMVQQLMAPIAPTAVQRLLRGATAADADVRSVQQIDVALLIPELSCEDRIALLNARQKLTASLFVSLNATTSANQSDSSASVTQLPPGLPFERRVQIANQLVALAGFQPSADADVKTLKAETTPATSEQRSIAWQAQQLRANVLAARRAPSLPASPAVLRRVAVLATLDMDPTLDDPQRSPATVYWHDVAAKYARTCSDWYEDSSRSLAGPQFFAEAARRFAIISNPGSTPYVRISQPLVLEHLSHDQPADSCRVTLAILGDFTNNVRIPTPNISISSPSPHVTFLPTLRGEGRLRELTVEATLSQQNVGDGIAGGLCEIEIDGHVFYFPVETPKLANMDLLELKVGPSVDGPFTAIDRLELRSLDGLQTRFFQVVNHANRDRSLKIVCPNVTAPATATADKSGAAEPAAPQSLETEVEVAAGGTAIISFPGKPPGKGQPLAGFTGPLMFEVWEGKEKVLAKSYTPQIVPAQQYVELIGGVFRPARAGGNSSLEISLAGRQVPLGPACEVSLQLTPESTSGFLGSGGGQTENTLKPNGQATTLQIEGLRFSPATESDPKQFWVGVDANPRAIGLVCNFPTSGTPVFVEQANSPQIQIAGPELIKSGGKLEITLDVSGVQAESSHVLINFGKPTSSGLATDFSTTKRAGRNISFAAAAGGKEGTLLLSASEENWQIDLPTDGVRGTRYVEAILYDDNDTELARTRHRVIVDGTPPVQVRWLSPAYLAAAGKPLDLSVMGLDPESGIADVTFFVGEPAGDKIPEGADLIQATSSLQGGATIWQGKLTMPKRLGTTTISAAVTNGVGLTTFIPHRLEVVETVPPSPAMIRGNVTEASRPQPGLPVDLYLGPKTKQSKPMDSTQTDAVGRYQFQGLPAGSYTVSVEKTASQRTTDVELKLKAGITETKNLELVHGISND